jgi:cellulose synthase/poly-beta-1,6-N-acetylglucosamine synthase-like glycosyltransferase
VLRPRFSLYQGFVSIIALYALLLLVYAYAGYPLAVAALARIRPARRVLDPAFTPMVSALIPAYNGASHLEAKIRSLQALDYPPDRLEVIIYSDGSSDGTLALAGRLAAADPRIRVMSSPTRRGKPTALNEMTRAAIGEVLLLTDVRQPLEPRALRALVERLADPTVACVSGNLVLIGKAGAGAYWRYENWIRRMEAAFRSMVGVTGPLYAIRRSDMAPLPSDVILDDMWVPMRQILNGRRVAFAEEAIAYDEAFGDRREFGRKVRTLAGNFQLLALMPALLDPWRNPAFFEFFSHKLLRLVSPFLLAILFISSAAAVIDSPATASELSRSLLVALWVGQMAFYTMAIFPAVGGPVGRLARTFVVMNYAAVVGMLRFVRGTQNITW